MPFVDAMKEACFAVFPVYVVLTVLAWTFGWRRLQGPGTLGGMAGCVAGAALAAQLELAVAPRYLLMALMVGIGQYLFGLLERRARRQGS
ncbi:hypothetical protein [Stenotrophomonas nitritireducens]|uniref:hypothetical protein n=1 Tax=Stenotrophomonas nitritireducens TaxID=83617 RepID=UPI003D9949A0